MFNSLFGVYSLEIQSTESSLLEMISIRTEYNQMLLVVVVEANDAKRLLR